MGSMIPLIPTRYLLTAWATNMLGVTTANERRRLPRLQMLPRGIALRIALLGLPHEELE